MTTPDYTNAFNDQYMFPSTPITPCMYVCTYNRAITMPIYILLSWLHISLPFSKRIRKTQKNLISTRQTEKDNRLWPFRRSQP